jgi:hypothetical protein
MGPPKGCWLECKDNLHLRASSRTDSTSIFLVPNTGRALRSYPFHRYFYLDANRETMIRTSNSPFLNKLHTLFCNAPRFPSDRFVKRPGSWVCRLNLLLLGFIAPAQTARAHGSNRLRRCSNLHAVAAARALRWSRGTNPNRLRERWRLFH